MLMNELIQFVEDKSFDISNDWYFHATRNDINIIKKILDEGIKASCFRKEKGSHFNGKYYISLYDRVDYDLNAFYIFYPKFVIDDINPLYADSNKFSQRLRYSNTILPFRTSQWNGEYQQFLKISPEKIVALRYDLSIVFDMLYSSDEFVLETLKKENLIFLRKIVLSLNELNKDLPIYDLSTCREINKEKMLSLRLDDKFI